MKAMCYFLYAALLCSTPFGTSILAQQPAPLMPPPVPSLEPDPFEIPPDQNFAALPADLYDAAFDRYVDLRLLGEGINERNAVLVADVALQLAEGERILLRAHKALAAKDALQLAVKLAADKRDKATLLRLAEYAKRGKDETLSAQVAAAQTLAASARAIDPTFAVTADGDTTVEQFAFLQRLARELKTAKLTGNAKELAALIAEVKTAGPDLLQESRKAALLKRLEAVQAELKTGPAPTPETQQLADVVDKLQEASRRPLVMIKPGYWVYYSSSGGNLKSTEWHWVGHWGTAPNSADWLEQQQVILKSFDVSSKLTNDQGGYQVSWGPVATKRRWFADEWSADEFIRAVERFGFTARWVKSR